MARWADTAGRCWSAVGGLYQPELPDRALATVLVDAIEMTKPITEQLIHFRDFTPDGFKPRRGSSIPTTLAASARLMTECIVTTARQG